MPGYVIATSTSTWFQKHLSSARTKPAGSANKVGGWVATSSAVVVSRWTQHAHIIHRYRVCSGVAMRRQAQAKVTRRGEQCEE
jgi:hypothetical protein